MHQSHTQEFEKFMEVELAQPIISVVRILELLIGHAHAIRASDIHLDPREDCLSVRMRVDGVLRNVYRLPVRIQPEMLARLKILAGLRTDEHQTPQDGRFRFEYINSDEKLDVRVSTIPTFYAENAVLRILPTRDELVSLDSIGLSSGHKAVLMTTLARPHGLILITGPTGSGKTSTLYALLQLLNTPDVSLVTIEDPIEHSIEGVSQIQVQQNLGLGFLEGLRSILRQDPNIIGIGEIRDKETASMAVHAALTGHLVLSTLHTTDASTAFSRLVDLGVEPYLIASTIQIVIGERLAGKLCVECRVRKTPSKEQCAALGLVVNGSLKLSRSYFASPGCDKCDYTGVSGRIGLFEMLVPSAAVRNGIMNKASARELNSLARADGMQPLAIDALQKAANGLIPVERVLALL